MHSPPKAAFIRKFMMAFQVFLSVSFQICETRYRFTARSVIKIKIGFNNDNDDDK